jgi:crotonobetainyl-CoA:carnitine CoA-transferase CaiB-like acyl-CoA transferase
MLQGTTVIDLTETVPGAFATKQLADFGAEVIKVENPRGGDPTRRLLPMRDGCKEPSVRSAFFCFLATNKRSVALDVWTPSGREVLCRLLERADVIVDTLTAAGAEESGVDYELSSSVRPDIVHASVTPFGRTGPYREFRSSELVLYGMGGEMYSTGIPDREPIKLAGNIAEIESGGVSAVAILSSLLAARRGLGGDFLDISCFEIQMAGIDRRSSSLVGYQYTGEITPRRVGWVSGGYPSGVYPCADGYFEISGGPPYWNRIKKMMGNPPELDDPKWTAPGAGTDAALKEEFERMFLQWTLPRTRREIWQAAHEAHAFLGPLNTIKDVVDDPHFKERGVFVDVDDGCGVIKMPGRPFFFSEGGWELRGPAPRLGEHTDEVLSEVGIGLEEMNALSRTGVIA